MTSRLPPLVKRAVKALLPSGWQPRAVGSRVLARLAQDGRIAAGLFEGLAYPPQSVGSANWPKHLGVYEIELAPWFERFDANPFGHVINVGAAEGYYALGLASRWPGVHVVAFEQDPAGRALLTDYAAKNGLSAAIEVRGACTPVGLREALECAGSGLLLMDVEGAENELLAGAVLPALVPFHVLVELHDLRVPGIGGALRSRFAATHRIEEVVTRPRRFADFAFPANPWLRIFLIEQLKSAADEQRGAPMRWFLLTPVGRPSTRPDLRR